MPKYGSVTDLAISRVESIDQLRKDAALAGRIRADFTAYVTQQIKRDGGFFTAYELAILQAAALAKFQEDAGYLGNDFFILRNPTFIAAQRSGANRIRDITVASAVRYHPENEGKVGEVISVRDTRDAPMRQFKLLYCDTKRVGKFLDSMCDIEVGPTGKRLLHFKGHYKNVLFPKQD